VTDFARRLLAAGPAPGVPDLFASLIGTWRVRNRQLDEASGTWSEAEFTWTFARILDGLGVQDVITLADGRAAGTTLRAWDADAALWRVNWFGVLGQNFCSLEARPMAADGIVLEGAGQDGRRLRWEFSGIRPRSFVWDGWIETRDGWLLEQHMDAERLD
jgi:hypothetical protein